MLQYFSSLLLLFTHLPFKFDSNVYHQLVQILIVVNFKSKTPSRKDANESQHLHPLLCVEYQRLMLRQFSEMHKYQRVQIHTNMVWKLCIYYGMVSWQNLINRITGFCTRHKNQ